MISLDIGLFRQNFPEFSDVDRYPVSQITFWATLAEAQLRQCVWKAIWTQAVSLYVAHEISLAYQEVAIAQAGGMPGIQAASGAIANKAVGGASIGFDTTSSAEDGAGVWNTTPYGKTLYRLIKMFGAGAIQIGARPFGIGPGYVGRLYGV